MKLRKVFAFIAVLLVASTFLVGQARTGNIRGTVVDPDGNPLPGVSVELTGRTTAPMNSVTSAQGIFRFLSLPPADDYAIKLELTGFKTKTETGIIVTIGANIELNLVMEVGVIEEQVTVVATTPIIDTKSTTQKAIVNYTALQSLPTARDPWVVLQLAPSIMVDRENIGGSDSGQQSGFYARGDSTGQNVWHMDGVNITDPSAIGATPTYFDFDVFEEMNIVTAGGDVEQMTSGIQIDLVTRRGTNRVSLGGRFYLTDERFQTNISDETLTEYPGIGGYNGIVNIKDFGFNAGGPLFKDKIWWWGSYGVQDIKTTVPAGTRDDTLLSSLAAKLNLQLLPQNRAEFFIHSNKKEKFGRSASTVYPPGLYQRGKFYWGSPIIKMQDEHMFGDDLFLSIKYAYNNSGFGLFPMTDTDLMDTYWYDSEKDLRTGASWAFYNRPRSVLNVMATYFNENLFGMSHEWKIGVEYDWNFAESVGSPAGKFSLSYNWVNEIMDYVYDDGVNERMVLPGSTSSGWRSFGLSRSRFSGKNGVTNFSVFAQDIINVGRLNIRLGLRYDNQTPWRKAETYKAIWDTDTDHQFFHDYYEIQQRYFSSEFINTMAQLLPDKEAEGFIAPLSWVSWSPRIGLTYDLFGTGKTILKASFAMFPEYEGQDAGLWAKGGLGGSFSFYWNDDGDNVLQKNEVYWYNRYLSYRPAFNIFDEAGNLIEEWTYDAADPYDVWLWGTGYEDGEVISIVDMAEGTWWSGFEWDDPFALTDSYEYIDPNLRPYTTWEGMVAVDHELLPDFSVGAAFTIRQYYHFNRTLDYYPAEIYGAEYTRNRNDYLQMGTVPDSFEIDGVVYPTLDAAGQPYYLLREEVYGETSYTRYDWNTNFTNDRNRKYWGFDLYFNKRMSKRWMLNGSLSYGLTRNYYGNTSNDPTNLWAAEGSIYAPSLGGSSGKPNMPIFTKWMLKFAGMYQFPWDINASFTFNAREGYRIGGSFGIYHYNSFSSRDRSTSLSLFKFEDAGNYDDIIRSHFPDPTLMSNDPDAIPYVNMKLPMYWMFNIRIEKGLQLGDIGKMYLMIDIFNPFNQTPVNRTRGFSFGTFYYNAAGELYRKSSVSRNLEVGELINPRVFRLGVRFTL